MTSVRTNLGPLTTPFTYPASCTVAVLGCSTCNLGWQAQTCGSNQFNTQGVQDDLGCWPPRSKDDLSSTVAVNGWGFYSPGLECPVGYTTACVSTPGVDGGFAFQFSVLAKETVAGCCPSGFRCSYNPGIDQAQTCYQVYSTGSFPTVQCSRGTSNKFSYITMPATVTATVSPTTTGGSPSRTVGVIENILVLAPLIQLNWQSSDRPISTTGSSSSETSQAAATQTQAPAAGSSGGLSQGATIGIAVAAAVIGLVLIGLLAWWIRKRRQNPSVMPTLPPSYQDKPHEMHTPMYAPMGAPMYVAEAPTETGVHEVEGYPKRESYGPRYEMSG